MKKILVLGCGFKRFPRATHLDINPDVKPDVIHDLTKYPWPFEDNQFKSIIAEHILEHIWTQGDVEGYFKLFREIWRICKNGAKVIIKLPYGLHPEAYADIGHRSFWTPSTFKFISKQEYKNAAKIQNAMSQYGIDFDFDIEKVTRIKIRGHEEEGPMLLQAIVKAIK